MPRAIIAVTVPPPKIAPNTIASSRPGKRHDHVAAGHHEYARALRPHPGQECRWRTDHQADGDGDRADEHRDLGAGHDLREHVAAVPVVPIPVGGRRLLEAIGCHGRAGS